MKKITITILPDSVVVYSKTKMGSIYDNITALNYECCCSDITQSKWDTLMKGAKRANKKLINRLVRKFLPDLYDSLVLDFHNPYNYFKTDTHLILIHSAIEYFLPFQVN